MKVILIVITFFFVGCTTQYSSLKVDEQGKARVINTDIETAKRIISYSIQEEFPSDQIHENPKGFSWRHQPMLDATQFKLSIDEISGKDENNNVLDGVSYKIATSGTQGLVVARYVNPLNKRIEQEFAENRIELKYLSNVEISNKKTQVAQSKILNVDDNLNNLLAQSSLVSENHKKWLFVIGIENYKYVDNISYAKRSAEMFANIVQKRLGVSQENSYVLINESASQAEIKNTLKMMLRRVARGDSIYFYYNGHGIPIPTQNNEPYILARDSNPDYIGDESFFSLKNIYKELSDSKAEKIFAFVDSCFSGVTDGKAVLKGVAATKMVAKNVEFNKEKMVVLTAGKGNQYSNGYDKKGHRLFSFYVMKNILEGKTDIPTLFKESKDATYDTSLKEYGDLRVQEPTIDGNVRLSL